MFCFSWDIRLEYRVKVSWEGRSCQGSRCIKSQNCLADAGFPYDNSGAPAAISDLVSSSSSSSSPAGKSSEDVPISTILASSNVNGEQSDCINYA